MRDSCLPDLGDYAVDTSRVLWKRSDTTNLRDLSEILSSNEDARTRGSTEGSIIWKEFGGNETATGTVRLMMRTFRHDDVSRDHVERAYARDG